MNINRKLHPQGKSLLRLLRASQSENAPFQAEGRRHPAALYAISLSQTLRRLEDVLEQLSAHVFNVQLNTGHQADAALAEATEALLLQLDRHLDDGLGIMAAYAGSDSTAYGELLHALAPLAEPRHQQANRLRFYDGKVRLFTFKGNHAVVPGFFIEGRDADGRAGPCPEVHGGRNTAFSYNLHLRRMFLDIVQLNTRLYDALRKQQGLKEAPEGPSENPELILLASRLATLGLHVFPDEMKSLLPNIAMKAENGMDSALVILPSLKKPQPLPLPCSISLSHPEGAGSDYRIPYSA